MSGFGHDDVLHFKIARGMCYIAVLHYGFFDKLLTIFCITDNFFGQLTLFIKRIKGDADSRTT
jgi:hypothetical protein